MTLPFDIFFLTQIPPLLLYSGASASLGGKKHNMAIVSHAQHPKEIIFCWIHVSLSLVFSIFRKRILVAFVLSEVVAILPMKYNY